jgi:hypothetical protein
MFYIKNINSFNTHHRCIKWDDKFWLCFTTKKISFGKLNIDTNIKINERLIYCNFNTYNCNISISKLSVQYNNQELAEIFSNIIPKLESQNYVNIFIHGSNHKPESISHKCDYFLQKSNNNFEWFP